MNEELQKALAAFIKSTLASLEAGKDFVVAEAPEVIQQLIRWNFWSAVFWCIVCAVVAVMIARFALSLVHKAREAKEYDRDDYYIPAAGIAIVCAGFTSAALHHMSTALQIYIAPKVWLIEWALEQVNQVK